MSSRTIVKTVAAQQTADGAGVRLRRTLGTPQLDHLDPFLLLDEFRSDDPDDYIAGFPDHPHRGFETVTYMLEGAMRHRDHAGNQGDLQAGSIQWMTAGRGIIHSEMPRQKDGLLWGFQLWVNLPAKAKMMPPRYQDIAPAEVPERTGDGVRVRVLAGESDGVRGPVSGIVTAPLYLDVRLQPGAGLTQPIPRGHNAFVYVYDGAAAVGGHEPLEAGHLAVLSDGAAAGLAAADQPARLLLVAALPLGEPVVRYGPFVMNTAEEIEQAFRDYRDGTLMAPG